MVAITPYQGGLPILHRSRQRGSGFFSAMKRFLIPVAKRVLPDVLGAASDIVSGGDVKTTLKRHAANAGSKVLHDIADHINPNDNTEGPPPRKKPRVQQQQQQQKTNLTKRARGGGGVGKRKRWT